MKRSEAIALQIKYSWIVLEHRWRYYCGRYWSEAVKKDSVSDERYDKIESDYKKLCKALGLNVYSCEMVSFDMSRPSCRLVHNKMCDKYGLDPTTAKVMG